MPFLKIGYRKICGSITVALLTTSVLIAAMLLQPIAANGWWDSSWQYRKSFTINRAKVGGSLVNFPVLIDVTDADLASKAQADGDDIAFTDFSGIKLDHEIERYNAGTGRLVAWVRVPSLSSTADTMLYMYYGNPSASNQQNPISVWDSGFRLVQHLEETSGTCYDSTANDYDGTPMNGLNQNAAGKVDGAGDFDGTDDYVQMSSDSGLPSGSSDRTLSVWVKIDTINNNRIFSYGQWSAAHAFDFMIGSGKFYIIGHTINYNTVKSDFQTGVWYNVVVVLESGQITFYWNGIKDSTQASSLNTLLNNGVFTIGRATPAAPREGPQCFDGIIDEVEFSSVARNAAWVSTSYENQNSPSTFYAVGPEELYASSEAPQLSNESPKNYAFGTAFNPTLSIHATDPQGDPMTIIFNSNASGTWQEIGRYTGVGEGTYTQITTDMNEYGTTYYWEVRASDGSHWTNNTYEFTTLAEWWNNAWQYRKIITIDHTEVRDALSNFPVMVDLKSSNFDFDKCKTDLEDIRFIDYFGNQLSYEIEKTPSSAGYRYWTRVPIDNTFAYTDGAHNIVPYDIDVDGNLELVACSYRGDTLQFYKYYGDPTVSSNWVRYVIDNNVGGGTGGSAAHYIAIADINGDGRMDLILAEDQQQEDVVAFLAPVDRLNMPAWQKHVLFDDDNFGVYHIEVGDVDGDGDVDISMATRSAGKVGWLENTGALDNWPATWIDQTVRDPFNARIGDFDHDGKGEIACNYGSTSTEEGYMLWYDFSGDPRTPANWVKHTMASLGTGSTIGPYYFEIVDIDGDGNLDILVSNLDQEDVFLLKNPYPGDVAGPWAKYKISDNHLGREYGVGDIDGDGDPDIVGADEYKDSIYWLENPGNPFTPNWQDHIVDTSGTYLDWVHCTALGDIDKDGDLDIAAAAATSNTFQWYVNEWYQPEKEFIVWVKLPSVSNVFDTAFYMYYGNPSATDSQNPTGVWDSGFKLVQHLKETSGTCYDSTTNDNDGTAYGGLGQGIAGKIGGAAEFDGTNDYVEMSSDSGLPSGASDRTLSVWVKVDTFNNSRIFSYGQWSADHAFDLLPQQSNQFWIVGHTNNYHTVKSDFQTGVWCNIVTVLQGSKITFYWNGIKDSTPSTTINTLLNNGVFRIGKGVSGTDREEHYFDGIIDEVQFSNVARSEAWVSASFENQNSPSTFYAVGQEEELITTKLYVNPPLIQKGPGDLGTTFKVNVTIQNVADLWGFDFNLTWDNTLITLVKVDFNTTLDSMWGGDNWFFASNKTGAGYYQLAAVSVQDGFNSTGTAPLAILEFRVETTNFNKETALHFQTDKLSDSQWSMITHTTEDGLYKISGKTPTLDMIPTSKTCRKYNETFVVKINVSEASNIKDFRFEIHYNATLLDVADVSWNAWGGTYTIDEAEGNLTGYASGSPISGDVTLLTITFSATYHHIWKDEGTISGWKNIQTGTIYFQWANLSYPSDPDLTYVRGGLNPINVGSDFAYTFSPIQGDVDNSGTVEVFDLRTVAAFYDQENPIYNLTDGPTIDIYDLVVVGSNFGYTYSP